MTWRLPWKINCDIYLSNIIYPQICSSADCLKPSFLAIPNNHPTQIRRTASSQLGVCLVTNIPITECSDMVTRAQKIIWLFVP